MSAVSVYTVDVRSTNRKLPSPRTAACVGRRRGGEDGVLRIE